MFGDSPAVIGINIKGGERLVSSSDQATAACKTVTASMVPVPGLKLNCSSLKGL